MKALVQNFMKLTYTFMSLFIKRTFTLMEGKNMKCEVILQRDEMRGENTEYCFNQTLSIYNNGVC